MSAEQYVYAGGSIGAQNAYHCDTCGCLVSEDRLVVHTQWHNTSGVGVDSPEPFASADQSAVDASDGRLAIPGLTTE